MYILVYGSDMEYLYCDFRGVFLDQLLIWFRVYNDYICMVFGLYVCILSVILNWKVQDMLYRSMDIYIDLYGDGYGF